MSALSLKQIAVQAKPSRAKVLPLPPALELMRTMRRWLVWRWELTEKGSWTKVPYRAAAPHRKASSTMSESWGTYDEALATFHEDRADGIGFALFESEIAAFDVDDCRDPGTGIIAPWAWGLIESAQSYTEVTVSGTGVRILGLAKGSKIHRNQTAPSIGGHIETYRRAERYIVITGDMLPGYEQLIDLDTLIDSTVERLDAEKRDAKEAGNRRPIRLHQTDISRYFEVARPNNMPAELDDLIRFGVPKGQRSDKFFHAVGWLKDRGHSPGEIEDILAAHPTGIAAKFMGRLRPEIERAFDKANTRDQTSRQDHHSREMQAERPTEEPSFVLKWHGDEDDTPLKEWLIDKTLPKVGTALLSGQWGTYKTFVGFDLSGSVITMAPFAGREVKRQGGVLWLAVEGQDEVRIRLVGLVNEKVRPLIGDMSELDAEHLPFVWVETCPKLSDPTALPKLQALVRAAADGMRDRFALPLAMILIDTLSPAAEFKDANDTAENQRVMTVLKTIAREFETLLIAVDHMGKDVSTGTRNSSVKEADVDAVLALLADRDLAGAVVNPRMAVRKVRGAPTGQEIKFDKRVVPVDPLGNTTLVIDWAMNDEPEAVQPTKAEKPAWTGKAHILKSAIERAMISGGVKRRPFNADGPEVRSVGREAIRTEFYKSYSADDAGTKRKAFNRLMDDAAAKHLIASREIGGIDWIWFDRGETAEETDSVPSGTNGTGT